MSVKLLLFRSGEQVLSDVKELVNGETIRAYVLNKPHKVQVNRSIHFSEEETVNDDRNLEITLTPWILLTEEDDIIITPDWVVTIVNPLDSIVKMYQEKVNGEID